MTDSIHAAHYERWHPIETAPRDGTPILGYADGIQTTVQWNALAGQEYGWWNLVETGAYAEDGQWTPTHWMPLPPGPNEQSATPNERWLYIRPRAKTENMMALTRDAMALVQKGLIDDPLAMPDDGGLVVLRADGSFYARYTKVEILSFCPEQREQP